MNQKLTELVFILDRSGSMAGLEGDTIGGYNAMLEKQKKEPGEAVVTTVLFDDQYELLHDRAALSGVCPITEKEYYVRGCTALLDAVGKTIQKIKKAQKKTAPPERAAQVLFVITTDGAENASREFTQEKIRQMIQRQTEKHKWEFLFLGANIDAISAAAQVGIDASRATNYNADSTGTKLGYEAVCAAACAVRRGRTLDKSWKEEIEVDYEMRGTKRG